jgi:hypothetical protein
LSRLPPSSPQRLAPPLASRTSPESSLHVQTPEWRPCRRIGVEVWLERQPCRQIGVEGWLKRRSCLPACRPLASSDITGGGAGEFIS